MAIERKTGAGRKPQNFDTDDGQYVKDGNASPYFSQSDPVKTLIERVKRATGQAKKIPQPDEKRNAFVEEESTWKNDLTPRGQTDIPDGETKAGFVQRELGVREERAQEYVDAIDAYADNLYSEIRAYQQGQSVEHQDEIEKISDDLEEYIKKAPRWNGGETFRGMGLSDEDLQKYTVGSEHDMKGVSSWSNEPIVAEEFADHYKKSFGNSVIFHSPTQNKGTGVRHLTRNEDFDEYEVIASKDSRYKVIKVEKHDDGRTHIFVEEIK